jgi:short-subunit dehydrogenase
MGAVKDLHGLTVLLTGASSGLGPYLARRLRAEGCRFVLSARREAELQALAAELGDAAVVTADLSRRGEAERLAEAAGPVDVLVANAGIPGNGRLTEFTIEQIDRVLDVNLRSAIALTRLALPRMLERRSGHIVLMASLAGKVPAPKSSMYNATKFGLRGFGHALAAELKGTGVGLSLISPTFVGEAGMFAESGARSPVRVVSPEEVAEATVRAIKRNQAEVVVAPVEQRLFGRLALAVPELLGLASGVAAVPDQGIERQRHKR